MSDVCFRAHWYLVVICFPGLEEPQYVKRDGRDSVQGDGGEGLGESEGEIHGENRSTSDEDKGKMSVLKIFNSNALLLIYLCLLLLSII